MQYRKKPVVIEAIQYTGNNGHELNVWSKGQVYSSPVLEPTNDNPTGAYVQIATLEGVMTGIVGDWIIKGVKGEFYPCKHDIFEATYEPASLVSPATAEREALEKIVREYKNAVSGSVWLSDAISNVNAIATAALEVK